MGEIAVGILFCWIIYFVGSMLYVEYEKGGSFKEEVQENIIYYIILCIATIVLISRTDYGLLEKSGLIVLASGMFCYFWSLLRTLWFEKIVLARASGAPIWQLALRILFFIVFLLLIWGGDPGPESYWEQQAGN